MNKITFKPLVSSASCRQEAALALFCAQHCAISPIGHLSELCKLQFYAKEIQLHRTKCTSIIKKVLAPHFEEELKIEVGENKYSLLIDESTDVSINKMLGKKLSLAPKQFQ